MYIHMYLMYICTYGVGTYLTANTADLPKVELFKEATCFGDP